MSYAQRIRMAPAYRRMSESELARKLGTTPQAFGQRMKTDKFSAEDMGRIASAMGATFQFFFTFEDGEKI